MEDNELFQLNACLYDGFSVELENLMTNPNS